MVWWVDSVTPSYQQIRVRNEFKIVDVSIESNLALASDKKGTFVTYSTSSGAEVGSVSIPEIREVYSAKLSPDGKRMLVTALAKEIRGYIGVNFENVSELRAKELGFDSTSGVLVTKIIENTPAVEAGFRSGDVIVEVDGVIISNDATLKAALTPGKETRIAILRHGGRF
jgi:hypothetical protein